MLCLKGSVYCTAHVPFCHFCSSSCLFLGLQYILKLLSSCMHQLFFLSIFLSYTLEGKIAYAAETSLATDWLSSLHFMVASVFLDPQVLMCRLLFGKVKYMQWQGTGIRVMGYNVSHWCQILFLMIWTCFCYAVPVTESQLSGSIPRVLYDHSLASLWKCVL